MMFDVEVTYRTMLGNLPTSFTTSERVATREEAEELRTMMRAVPGLEGAKFLIKNAPPPPTVDEAFEHFRKGLAEYKPVPAAA